MSYYRSTTRRRTSHYNTSSSRYPQQQMPGTDYDNTHSSSHARPVVVDEREPRTYSRAVPLPTYADRPRASATATTTDTRRPRPAEVEDFHGSVVEFSPREIPRDPPRRAVQKQDAEPAETTKSSTRRDTESHKYDTRRPRPAEVEDFHGSEVEFAPREIPRDAPRDAPRRAVCKDDGPAETTKINSRPDNTRRPRPAEVEDFHGSVIEFAPREIPRDTPRRAVREVAGPAETTKSNTRPDTESHKYDTRRPRPAEVEDFHGSVAEFAPREIPRDAPRRVVHEAAGLAETTKNSIRPDTESHKYDTRRPRPAEVADFHSSVAEFAPREIYRDTPRRTVAEDARVESILPARSSSTRRPRPATVEGFHESVVELAPCEIPRDAPRRTVQKAAGPAETTKEDAQPDTESHKSDTRRPRPAKVENQQDTTRKLALVPCLVIRKSPHQFVSKTIKPGTSPEAALREHARRSPYPAVLGNVVTFVPCDEDYGVENVMIPFPARQPGTTHRPRPADVVDFHNSVVEPAPREIPSDVPRRVAFEETSVESASVKTNADSNSDSHSASHSDSRSDSNSDSHSNSNWDSDSDSNSNSNSDSESNSKLDSNSDLDSYSYSDSYMYSTRDANWDSDLEVNVDSDSDADEKGFYKDFIFTTNSPYGKRPTASSRNDRPRRWYPHVYETPADDFHRRELRRRTAAASRVFPPYLAQQRRIDAAYNYIMSTQVLPYDSDQDTPTEKKPDRQPEGSPRRRRRHHHRSERRRFHGGSP